MDDMTNITNENLDAPEELENEEPLEGEELPVEEGEEGQEQEEPIDMNEKVPFVWKDSEGNEIEDEISLQQLQEDVSFARNSKALIEEQNSFINSVQPLIQTIQTSDLLKTIFSWKDQNATDESILAELARYYNQRQGTPVEPEPEPEFDTIEDKVNYLVQKKLDEAMKTKVDPLANQYKQAQMQSAQERTLNQNVNVLEDAMRVYGYDPKLMNENQLKKVQKTILDVFPGIDLSKVPLNKTQANIILNQSLGYRKGAITEKQGVEKSKNILRQTGAPTIQTGRSLKVANNPLKSETKKDGTSIEDRQKLWHSLF